MSFITSPGVIVPPLTAGGVAYGTGSQAKVNSAGTAGQLLTSSGAGVPVWGAGPATVTVFSASGTWTKPSGTTFVQVELWGGAGGGGAAGRPGTAGTQASNSSGSGGGGGSPDLLLIGGSGGAGSAGGGGGGGGSASVNGVNSGAGGAGGDGYAIIYSW